MPEVMPPRFHAETDPMPELREVRFRVWANCVPTKEGLLAAIEKALGTLRDTVDASGVMTYPASSFHGYCMQHLHCLVYLDNLEKGADWKLDSNA